MNTQVKYCGECGVKLPVNAMFCGECGAPVISSLKTEKKKSFSRKKIQHPQGQGKNKPDSPPLTPPAKSKKAAILWGAFLGGLGAHKFYMGSWGWGLLYLLTCWLMLPFLIATVEWVRYVLMTDDEFNRKAAAFKNKGPFGFFW